MSTAELADLLAQVRAGDSDAWGDLYRQYAPAIFRFAGGPADARRCGRRHHRNIHESTAKTRNVRFVTALHGVAIQSGEQSLLGPAAAQANSPGSGDRDLETLPLEHPDPSQLEQLQIDHDSKHVRAGLAKLPDRARMALVLRYYSEMSYDEIADTLGVRRAFVGVLLLRARHQLREVLAESGGGLHGAAAGGRP